MLRILLNKIYALPKWEMVLFAATGIMVWVVANLVLHNRLRRAFNILLCASGFTAIVVITLLCRSHSNYVVSLVPFITFIKAKTEHDYYRDLILNCILFIPFGLGLSGALPDEFGVKKRVLIVIGSGLVLSVCVEALQYALVLGNAETDDVIFNTLGTAISAIAAVFVEKINLSINHKKASSKRLS